MEGKGSEEEEKKPKGKESRQFMAVSLPLHEIACHPKPSEEEPYMRRHNTSGS
jgi:hypothetical protein